MRECCSDEFCLEREEGFLKGRSRVSIASRLHLPSREALMLTAAFAACLALLLGLAG